MKNMEKIDVLLATYNGEKYLKEQLDSILKQTYSNIRLIISDDCSNDNTRKILSEYAEKDNRIELYFQEKNKGYLGNFEFLLGKVENELYMLSDQDDVWKEDKIERTYKKMKESDADLVFTDLEVVDEKLQLIDKSFWRQKGFYKKLRKDKKYNYRGLFLNNYITGCTILTKKKFTKDILPFPKSKYISHDYWIAIVISQSGNIEYLDYSSIKYRQHEKNLIGNKRKSDTINDFDELRNLFIDVKIDLFNTYKQNLELFDGKIKDTIIESQRYFLKLKNGDKINFKDFIFYEKLYKYENRKYRFLNFIILNCPKVAKKIFEMKKVRKV